jgi:hypothetical protein
MQLAFSKGVPQICQLIHEFITGFNQFARDFDQQHIVIHELLKKNLDNILVACSGSMLALLDYNNLSQAVQILINMIEFERASVQFEDVLRNSPFVGRERGGLGSVAVFRNFKGVCEKKVFELVVCDWGFNHTIEFQD